MTQSEQFIVDGMVLEIPVWGMTPFMRNRLERGQYEGQERQLTREFLRPGDKVLDLGAGAGLVASLAASIVGPENVTAVEANPAMHPFLRRNLRRNGAQAVRTIKGAVAGPRVTEKEVTLNLEAGFWASSILRASQNARGAVTVPVKRFDRLLRATGASVVIMDIEGAEDDILTRSLPAQLRLLIVEMHPDVYGAARLTEIQVNLMAQGFVRVDDLPGCRACAYRRE
ncbi:MAG: FkbM family methyltransferase [Paracoccus sp. (in: a-proteobacteria)]|nr:FkbM family methyltransferase [Paracoccus sp. (in: a-proteobacteria)]